MKFDKLKVYTALNADEVKVGSKGYFADSLGGLRTQVEPGNTELKQLTAVTNDFNMSRFCTGSSAFVFFYLVEEPQEKKLRPYSSNKEVIKAITAKNGVAWIKNKHSGTIYLIIGVCGYVKTFNDNISMTDLLDDFTYLDGSPCGIEE